MRYLLAAFFFCLSSFGAEPEVSRTETADEAGKTQLAFLFKNAGTKRDLIYEVRWFWPSKEPTLEKFSLDSDAVKIHFKEGAIGAQIEYYGMVYKAKTVRIAATKTADEADCEDAKQHLESPDGGKTIRMADGDGSAHEAKIRAEAEQEKCRYEKKLERQELFKFLKENDERVIREEELRRREKHMQEFYEILQRMPLPVIF